MHTVFEWGGRVLDRLREPSTWAGLAILGSLLGVKGLEQLAAPEIAATLAALAATLLPERRT